MAAYLQEVQKLLGVFEAFELNQIPRAPNSHADALARLASAQDTSCTKNIPVEFLPKPSTKSGVEVMALTVADGSWRCPLVNYLQKGILPEDKMEARAVCA